MTAANYLHAHPGFRQKIGDKFYVVKWMHATREGADECIKKVKATGKFKEVVFYERKIDGKLFGKHPYCVAVKRT